MVNKLELYKEWYFKGVENKKSLDDGLTLPFGAVSALVTVWFYFVTQYDYRANCSTLWAFIIFMGIFFILIAIAAFFLLKSYITSPFKTYDYANLLTPMQIEKYYAERVSELKAANKPEGMIGKENELADQDLEQNLIEMYKKAATNDMFQNSWRTANFFKGKLALYYCAITLLINSMCFGYNYYMKGITDNIYKVQLVSPK